MRCRTLLLVGTVAAFAALLAAPAEASRYVRYGIQDDAWLEYGPGTLDQRVARLQSVGIDLARVTLSWNTIERRRGKLDWRRPDALLRALHARKIEPVVTLYGSPRWANRGRAPNWAPTSGSSFASFAVRVARRYPFVRRFVIWNEPNQVRWLRPTSATIYVTRLLNPAYRALHRVRRSVLVGGGVTAPRGSRGGMSPVDWIAEMDRAHASLDAYAHNPYPLRPRESPWAGGCDHCTTITLSTIDRLLTSVRRAFGPKRIWLTEYGYQTNPPDRLLGVSKATQARYVGEAALRAYLTPRVDMLVHYLVQDEPELGRWQSGVLTTNGLLKPSYAALVLPLAQRGRSGPRTTIWGQVRPGAGRQPYRLQQRRAGGWQWIGATQRTDARGFFTRTVPALPGAQLRIWSPRSNSFSFPLTVRSAASQR